MSTVADKVLNALDKALAKPKATIFDFLCEQSPEASIPKAEIHALRDAEKAWRKALAATGDFSEQGAKMRWAAHLADGTLDHLDEATRTRSLQSLVTEYESKQLVAKGKMGEASIEAAKVVNVIRARLLPIAEAVLTARQKAEQAEAERFGLVPVPSALTTALAQFTNGLKSQAQGSAGNPPRQMCAGLLNLN